MRKFITYSFHKLQKPKYHTIQSRCHIQPFLRPIIKGAKTFIVPLMIIYKDLNFVNPFI